MLSRECLSLIDSSGFHSSVTFGEGMSVFPFSRHFKAVLWLPGKAPFPLLFGTGRTLTVKLVFLNLVTHCLIPPSHPPKLWVSVCGSDKPVLSPLALCELVSDSQCVAWEILNTVCLSCPTWSLDDNLG